MGQVRRLEAQHGRHIRWRGNDHGLGQTFRAQRFGNKGLHLASAFTNQPDHHHIGFGKPGEHSQKYAFADARSGHQADALPTPQS